MVFLETIKDKCPDLYTCMMQAAKIASMLSFSLSNRKFFLQFFDSYEKLLTSTNYVTRRQSLKVSSHYSFLVALCLFDPLDVLTIECSWILASLGISFGVSKFPYYEALHFGSSVLESHDDIAEGIGLFFLFSFILYDSFGVILFTWAMLLYCYMDAYGFGYWAWNISFV